MNAIRLNTSCAFTADLSWTNFTNACPLNTQSKLQISRRQNVNMHAQYDNCYHFHRNFVITFIDILQMPTVKMILSGVHCKLNSDKSRSIPTVIHHAQKSLLFMQFGVVVFVPIMLCHIQYCYQKEFFIISKCIVFLLNRV